MERQAALYCRVSTEKQEEEGTSLETQQNKLLSYCDIRSFDLIEKYIDGGYSGANLKRPALTRLIDDVRAGKIHTVIVFKLDRMSRSQKDMMFLLEDIFSPNNVEFISITEGFDTTSTFGRAMVGILSVFAQLERENIKERTRLGKRERAKQGYWHGGGNQPYGYDYIPETNMLVQNDKAHIVKKVFDLYLQGYSCDAIAQATGLKYDRLVVQILQGKVNAGYVYYRGETYKGHHEPIVSEDVYNKAMEIMESRRAGVLRGGEHLLTGLLYCGKCGARFRYQKWGKAGSKVYCYSQQSSKQYLIKDPNCDNDKLWASDVEDAVLADVMSLALNPDKLENKAISKSVSYYDELEHRSAVIEKKIANLLRFIADGVAVDETKEMISALKIEQSDIAEKLSKKRSISRKTEIAGKTLKTIADTWNVLDFREKRAFLQSIITKIVLTGNLVEVYYSFFDN